MEEIFEWKLSKKGNPYTTYNRFNVVVFKRRKGWAYRTQRKDNALEAPFRLDFDICTVSPFHMYLETEEQAKEMALLSVWKLEQRLAHAYM